MAIDENKTGRSCRVSGIRNMETLISCVKINQMANGDIINMQFDHNIVYPTYSKTVKYGSASCTMQQGFPIN
eukprot:scaffold20982_cov70-Cyclotella_meneghiniana.AAC.8